MSYSAQLITRCHECYLFWVLCSSGGFTKAENTGLMFGPVQDTEIGSCLYVGQGILFRRLECPHFHLQWPRWACSFSWNVWTKSTSLCIWYLAINPCASLHYASWRFAHTSFKNLMNFRAMNFMVFCINCSFDVIDCCLFPQIGLTKSATASEQLQICIVQGNIAKWHKKEGDAVSAGDVLCEIETVSSCALSCYWYVQAWKCSSWPMSFLVPSMFRFWVRCNDGTIIVCGRACQDKCFWRCPRKGHASDWQQGFFFRFCEINNWPSFPEISKINQYLH
jgi:hypothetical protein